MFSFRVAVLLATTIFLASYPIRTAGQGTEASMFKKRFAEDVAKVKNGKTSNERTDAAEDIADMTRNLDPSQVDNSELASIASLLDTHEDSVRLWVAASLGNLGPRASVAVPKLLAVLKVADCIFGDLTSASAIRLALERIGAKPPPPPDCHNKHR